MNQVNELDLFFDNYVSSDSIDLYQASSNSLPGCFACDCSALGSIDNTCNQTTGLCRCKFNVKGDKCEICQEGFELTELGCVSSKSNEFFIIKFNNIMMVSNK